MRKCYFDHAAANPLHPAVLDAMLPYLGEQYGNPQSIYELGSNARKAVDNARQQIAALINVRPATIVFTSSGTEANNFALRGAALSRQMQGRHIITSKIEHQSVLNSARFLEKSGFAVTQLPVDRCGLIDPAAVEAAIMPETILVSITHASREIGTIEPIRQIAEITRKHNILLHTDGVATVGNIPVDAVELGVDMISMTAHQFYGPKGIGALYIREGLRVAPLIYGGIQEGGRRAGTENVASIAGMGMASELARLQMNERIPYLSELRNRLISGLKKIPDLQLTGHPEQRLPNHASFVVEYVEGEAMLLMLSMKGIYSSSGSACSSRSLKSSPVLLSLGVPAATAQGSIVFTLGMDNSLGDIDYFLDEFENIIYKLREMSPFSKAGKIKY
ncbi:MAG: cysteine desulfurase family protein [Dissulfurispiraceae bacterium]|jgi:cysteine desulfurase|nr:cysteine desulfurase family protein [Dissulfurispiraceae bacterium]